MIFNRFLLLKIKGSRTYPSVGVFEQEHACKCLTGEPKN